VRSFTHDERVLGLDMRLADGVVGNLIGAHQQLRLVAPAGQVLIVELDEARRRPR